MSRVQQFRQLAQEAASWSTCAAHQYGSGGRLAAGGDANHAILRSYDGGREGNRD